jgi:hypothetical protein
MRFIYIYIIEGFDEVKSGSMELQWLKMGSPPIYSVHYRENDDLPWMIITICSILFSVKPIWPKNNPGGPTIHIHSKRLMQWWGRCFVRGCLYPSNPSVPPKHENQTWYSSQCTSQLVVRTSWICLRGPTKKICKNNNIDSPFLVDFPLGK